MSPMAQIGIKVGIVFLITLIVAALCGWGYNSFVIGDMIEDEEGYRIWLYILPSVLGACSAAVMVGLTDFFFKKQEEPKPGEKSVDQIREELNRRVKEGQKFATQVEESKGRIMALSSLMVSLSNMAKVVGSTLDPKEVITITMENVIRNMKATKASLILVDPESQRMTLGATHGWDAAEIQTFSEKFGEGIVGYVAEKQVVVDEDALKTDPNLSQMTKFSGKKTYICAPLHTKDTIVGVLNIEAVEKKRTESKTDEMRLVTILTSLAGMAIQNARMFKKTQEWATIDALTGLHNRRAMLDFFENQIKKADAEGTEVAFFMSDIDHFKGFNDTYGHAIGDFVLAGVAQEYKVVTREQDLAGRYGGEEFGQILPATNKAEARKIAEQLRKNIEAKKFNTEAGVLSVTVSVGVASYPEDGKNLEEVRDAADDMLYVCKESGRNRVCVRGVDKIDEIVALKIKTDKLKNTDPEAAKQSQRELNKLLIERGRIGEVKPVEGDPPLDFARHESVVASVDNQSPQPAVQHAQGSSAAAPAPGPRPPVPPGARPPGAPPAPGPRPPAPPGARPPGAPPAPGPRPPAPPGARPPGVPPAPGPRPPAPPGARPPGAPPAPGPRPSGPRPPSPGVPRPPRPPGT